MAAAERSSADAMPAGFGIARIEETGTATHELIYEYDYFPQPVTRATTNSESAAKCNGVRLRPAVRNGKVDFSFYGNRVPLSADHARCWMGHLLLSEVRKGSLAHVEFIVRRHQDLQNLNVDGPAHPRRHGPQPSWLWDVWHADANCPGMQSGRMERPGVEVLMRMSAACGIELELFCAEEEPRAAVYRVLKQYCDDDLDTIVWRPIPDPPSRVSKVQPRQCSLDLRQRQLVGVPVPESGSSVLARSLKDWDAAETILLQAISRAQVVRSSATSRELFSYCSEVRDALEGAARVWLKLRAEWIEPVTSLLEALLRNILETKDTEILGEALEMTNSICAMGIRPPDNLTSAEKARAS